MAKTPTRCTLVQLLLLGSLLAFVVAETEPSCRPVPIAGAEICDDLLDNDADGRFDCDDEDCDTDPACACTPDSNEPDTPPDQLVLVVDGPPVARSICPANEQDWATFTLAVDSVVAITTGGPVGGDTNMSLYNGGDYSMTIERDHESGDYAEIVATLAAGTYDVLVFEPGADDELDLYTIEVQAVPLHETLCEGGVDEDLDGVTDCDDEDCDTDPACACTPDSYEPDTPPDQLVLVVDGPPVARSICPANEQDWATFTLAVDSVVAITTGGPVGGDTNMSLYNGGDYSMTIERDHESGDYAEIVATLAAGTYDVLVFEPGADDELDLYTIEVQAVPLHETPKSCEAPATLTCSSIATGHTETGASLLNGYACSAVDESGPEHVYELTVPQSRVATIALDQMTADLDIFVVEGSCDPQAPCVAWSVTGGDEEVSFLAEALTTYYVIVDGYSGAMSSYDLTVLCDLPAR